MSRYDLDGSSISVDVWRELFDNANLRIIAQNRVGRYFVSTVWIGIDHNYSGVGPPLIYETMVFYPNEDWTRRYSTWESADLGHTEVLLMIENGEFENEF